MQHILACKDVLTDKFFCETCILAKAHRMPFDRSTISTKVPFELIHMDLWGSYRIANINGAHYFLTIVDDFTRNTWTQLLHAKTQVYAAIEQFLNMVETQFKAKVIMIRSDNGTEFLQSACLNLFAARGILHQRSMVKTPQQNGVVERKHRHLLDTARAIRLFAGFPKSFWGECVLAATHIINKLPMANLHWKTPFEMLYGQTATLEDLRTIGCLCYASKIGETDKFEPRARKCVLLGYTFGLKGYKLYDMDTRKVFHSRDVIFNEQQFPFREKHHLSTSDLSSFP